MSTVTAPILAALREIVGEPNLLSGRRLAELDPGYHPDNTAADCLVRPASNAEVAAIARLCNDNGVAIVPQGGRTGLAGGAASGPGQIILDLGNMAVIERVDGQSGIATVGAGATLQSLADAAAQHGLCPGIDLGARGTATIGGMISTNAGGMEAFRHGAMRNRVLGLEVVLANGEVLDEMSGVIKRNEGYDLKQLFCGAEGTLGIITRASLKLEPLPGPPHTALLGCSNAAGALRWARACQAHGAADVLHAEVMWRDAARIMAADTGLARVLEFCDPAVYLVLEFDCRGTNSEDLLGELLDDPGLADGLLDAVVAKNEAESRDIWTIRESSFAIDKALPHGLWFDISVPPAMLDAYVDGVSRGVARLDGEIGVFAIGHLMDGNLHFTISRGVPMPADICEAIKSVVYGGLLEIGGSYSAEHGIGLEKRDALHQFAGDTKLRLMRDLKAVFDPRGIMNPGKVI